MSLFRCRIEGVELGFNWSKFAARPAALGALILKSQAWGSLTLAQLLLDEHERTYIQMPRRGTCTLTQEYFLAWIIKFSLPHFPTPTIIIWSRGSDSILGTTRTGIPVYRALCPHFDLRGNHAAIRRTVPNQCNCRAQRGVRGGSILS